jgi:hypothetical protein
MGETMITMSPDILRRLIILGYDSGARSVDKDIFLEGLDKYLNEFKS